VSPPKGKPPKGDAAVLRPRCPQCHRPASSAKQERGVVWHCGHCGHMWRDLARAGARDRMQRKQWTR